MSDIEVSGSRGSYTIRVALGASAEVGESRAVIVDPVVEHAIAAGDSALIRFEADESRKTLAGVEQVLVELHRAGVRRGDVVAAVGGGVVQDVATLSCSLYMRGLPWVYVPTTLMAMADSCIGGKSSINAGGIKNLVGNFYPPQRILVDPSFISQLPLRARVAGLAEAVKICFAGGGQAFDGFLASEASLVPGADESTADLIAHVLRTKKWFVEVDEFDRAERQLLNFGHSFGHAWEAACGFAVPHGVGVAAGMLAALRHPASGSSDAGGRLHAYTLELSRMVADEIRSAAEQTDWAVFRAALASDKKNTATHLRLVLPDGAGGLGIIERPLTLQELERAQEALREALEEIIS